MAPLANWATARRNKFARAVLESVAHVDRDAELPRYHRKTLLGRAADDDRENIQPEDSVLLVIDDDATYSRIVLDAAHEHGYKVLAAGRGDMGLAHFGAPAGGVRGVHASTSFSAASNAAIS